MRNTICFIVLSLSISSCARKGNSEKAIAAGLDEFKTYPIDISSKAIPIFDLIQQVEVMRLEETEASLLGDIYSVERLEDEYVITYPRTGDNYFFNRKGRFLRAFNHSGTGPKEYAIILNSWTYDGGLEVFDSQNMRIHRYSKLGEWLGSKRIPHTAFSVAYHNEEYFLDVSRHPIEGEHFAVAVLDKEMELKQKAIPLEDLKAISLSWGINDFKPYKEGLIYNDVMDDTVYVYKRGAFKPLFSVDFGDNWIWRDREVYTDFQKANAMMQKKDAVYSFGTFVGERFLYLQHTLNFKVISYLVDRESGKVQKVKSVKNGSDKNSLVPIRWEEGRLLLSMRSTEAIRFLSEVEGEKKTFREGTTLEAVETSENPVLMWIEFF